MHCVLRLKSELLLKGAGVASEICRVCIENVGPRGWGAGECVGLVFPLELGSGVYGPRHVSGKARLKARWSPEVLTIGAATIESS